MTDPSRPALRLVSSRGAGPRPGHDASTADAVIARVTTGGPDTTAGTATDGLGRSDVTGLRDELAADVDRLAERAGDVDAADLQVRWETLRGLCEPADLDGLADHARSLHEAAASVRRQHVETAEDLGPLWDTWEGPAAEAVQDRVSALARSAHALVVELETTAERLGDAHAGVLMAVEALADDLAERPSGTPMSDLARSWDEAVAACAHAWDAARRVLAGQPDVSRSGPRFP